MLDMERVRHWTTQKIDSYGAPVRGGMGQRGLGKTFGSVKKALRTFVKCGKRFVYVVETEDMIQELSQNNGEKFFAGIFGQLEKSNSKRDLRLLTALQAGKTEVIEGEVLNKIKGGTIVVAGSTAGYIVAINAFAKIKRNNFRDVAYIIIDEFIPENVDIRYLRYAYKMVSLIQSIARLNDIIIYMFCNSIRVDDLILQKMGCSNMRLGEIRVIRDKFGPLLAFEYINPADYPEFTEASERSVAGRFASLMGETSLDKNIFKETLPESLRMPEPPRASHLYICIHGNGGSVRIRQTQDHSEFYVVQDSGYNKNRRYCFEEKFVTPVVKLYKDWKKLILQFYADGRMKFDSPVTYMLFKSILGLDSDVA